MHLGSFSIATSFFSVHAGQPAQTQPVIQMDAWLGVNAHPLWFSEDVYGHQLDRLQELGLKWLRLDLHRAHLEPVFVQFPYTAKLDRLMQALDDRQMQELV